MMKLLNKWRELEAFIKIVIIAIPIAIVLFTLTCIDTDWGEFLTTEEDYLALERVAYDIIESKNVMQPLSNKLENYTVSFNDDGTIDFTLYGYAESLRFSLSENFEVQRMSRGLSVVILVIILAVLITFVMSIFMSVAFYYTGIGVKKIYLFFKK